MTTAAPPQRQHVSSVTPTPRRVRWGDDFLATLGNVPIERVVFDPPPNTVTGEYYDAIDGRVDGILVELVGRTLVRKPMGMDESRIGMNFGIAVGPHVRKHKLGFVAGADGTVRMSQGNRRMPDVAVYLKADYPDGKRPTQKVPSLPPRLTVEVLSEDNTAAEIDMKLHEYFASGCLLAYVIDPKTKTARRHTSAREFTEIAADGELDGGDVLPGWSVPFAELFDEE
ncbi:MAG: Uma2 family endonuclease [Planctomycetota bacterium]